MKRKQLYLLSLAFIGLVGRANAQCASPGWIALGPNDSTSQISFGESEYEGIAVNPTNNVPYVVYRDGGNFYGASVKKYVGGKWQQVGPVDFSYGATSSEIYASAITIDKFGNPYVAVEDKGYANHCTVYKFNGTTWDTLPGQIASFTEPAAYLSITTDNNGVPYVAYQDGATSKMDVLMYNASASKWVPVGPKLAVSKAQAQYCQIAFDRVHNVPYVAFEDGFKPNHADHLMVYSFNGTSWNIPGIAVNPADSAGLTTDTVNFVSLTIDKKGNPFIAYEDFSDGKNLGMMMFDSATSTWTADTVQRNKYLGGPVNYVSAGVDSIDNVYVGYQDLSSYGYEGLSIAEFSGTKSSWDFVGNTYKVSQSISASDAIYVSTVVDKTGTPWVAYEDKGVGDHAEVFSYSSTNKQWLWMSTTGLSNINAGTWNGMAGYTSIAASPTTNTPYIAYRDGNTSSKATVMSYTGTTWAPVGAPGISLGGAKFTNMGFDSKGDPICMFSDDGATAKYSVSALMYNGTAWTAIGTNAATLSGANCYYTSMTVANGDTVYAAFQIANRHMSVMKCAVTGTTWVNIGSADVNGDTAAYQSIAVDKNGNVYVAFQDNATNQLGISVMEYTAGAWSYVGARNISAGEAVYASLKINPVTNMPVVAYSSYGSGTEANVQEWNGTAWVYVGAPGFSNDWTSYMSLTIDPNGVYYVAYEDWGNEVQNQGQDNCTVEKFNTKTDTAWVFMPVGGSCSQNGSSYEACTLDANGNVYVAYSAYSAFVKELTCTEGVNEINGNNNVEVNVYPNPNHGSFTVALQNAPAKSYVNVFNILGENIYQAKLTSDKTQVNLGTQATGIYLYRVLDENGNVLSTGKLIIQ